MLRPLTSLALIALLSGCTGPGLIEEQDSAPLGYVDVSKIPDPVPKYEPYSKYGNPASYEALGKTYYVKNSAEGYQEKGIASWYGTKFHGKRTSSGEPYDMYKMTAAHKSLPLPTYAEVTNLENGRKIIVKINDRGPFKEGRIIDLSYAAAIKLGIDKQGTGKVEVRAITVPPDNSLSSEVAQVTPMPQPAPLKVSRIERMEPLQDPVSTTNIFLQVGSFGERQNMQRMLNRLLDASIDNVVVHQPSANNPYYKLRIGPLTDRHHADQLASQLQQMGFAKPYVIVD